MFYIHQQIEFTSALKQVLHQQSVGADHPGTILADFQTLLDFIGDGSLPVTGSHLLSLKFLKPLNERLSQPIELGLKRPQQKSYPHINGLYLLLRATSLGIIDSTPKKPQLVLDPVVLASWEQLTPTERYFTLLETWALRGRGEIIGDERGHIWSDLPIISWTHFFEMVPNEGLQIIGNRDMEERIKYWPKLHNLALLELFGLVQVIHSPPIEGQGWRIEQVQRTPLGDALLAAIVQHLRENFEALLEFDDVSEIPFGMLQSVFQPYFPAWQNYLILPATNFQEGLYVFRVSLWQNKIWRRIAIPSQLPLDSLTRATINAYAFGFDHLYQFTYLNRFGATKRVAHPYIEEYSSTDEVLIGELPLQLGASMEFLYDFGDSWIFEVILEKIEPPDPSISRPILLESHGQAPTQYG